MTSFWVLPAGLLLILQVAVITLWTSPSTKDLTCDQRVWNGVWEGTNKDTPAGVKLLFNNKSIDTNGKPIKRFDKNTYAQYVSVGPAPKSFNWDYVQSDNTKFYQRCNFDIIFRQQWYPDGIELYEQYEVYWKAPQAQQFAGYNVNYILSICAINLILFGLTIVMWSRIKKDKKTYVDIEQCVQGYPVEKLVLGEPMQVQNYMEPPEAFELTTSLYPQIK